MKVVLDARVAQGPRIGLGVYVTNLVQALATLREDLRLILVTSRSRPPLDIAGAEAIEVKAVAPSLEAKLDREVWEQVRLPRLLKEVGADVYHGPAYTVPCLRPTPCPTVVTFYDASLFAFPEYYRWVGRTRMQLLMRLAALSAAGVICGSEHARAECVRCLGESLRGKARAIYAALPRELETLGEPSPESVTEARRLHADGCDYLFSVGTVHPRKNYERLIEAFARLERPGLKLLICGQLSWNGGKALEAARRLGLGDRVRFLGNVATREMRSLMKGAEVFVFPSLYEGFGIPPLEAFAAGVPVAASSASSIPEVTGDAAVLFDPLSVQDMADAIRRLLDDADLRQEMTRRGGEQLSRFSWERCAQEHLDVYRSAVADGGRGKGA